MLLFTETSKFLVCLRMTSNKSNHHLKEYQFPNGTLLDKIKELREALQIIVEKIFFNAETITVP